MLLSVAPSPCRAGSPTAPHSSTPYLSYALFGLAYSLVNIPFGSLASAMTQLPRNGPSRRGHPAVPRGLPQITRSENLQRSLTITTLVLAVVGIAVYLFAFKTSREIVERDAAPVSLKQSLAAVGHNRPLAGVRFRKVVREIAFRWAERERTRDPFPRSD
jgi:glucuronide carrier protein